MTVGERIKQKRIDLGLSQQELAKRAGYSDKTAISKIEHSGNEITLKQVKRIAKALNIDPTEIMGWDVLFEKTKSLPTLDANAITNDQIPTLPDLINSGDRKEARISEYAKILYENYQKASPEIQKAVDLLLKADKQN